MFLEDVALVLLREECDEKLSKMLLQMFSSALRLLELPPHLKSIPRTLSGGYVIEIMNPLLVKYKQTC